MSTGEHAETADSISVIRERVMYEDTLLNNRTTIILALNGLIAVAASNAEVQPIVRLLIALIMVLIDVLWIGSAHRASQFIKGLTLVVKANADLAPRDEQLRFSGRFGTDRGGGGTTGLFSIWIPSCLVAGWLLAILLHWVLYRG